ncbi:hypothetical protein D3C81_725880 [compost metagenome]
MGFLYRLGTQERVQCLELAYFAGRAPDMKTVAGNAQVQVGARDQPVGDAHLGQLFMSQSLFMNETGRSGGDLRLIEAADGGHAVAIEFGDDPFYQQQLVAEGNRVEVGPAGKAHAHCLQRGQVTGKAARCFRAAQSQAMKQVVVREVDVRGCRPGMLASTGEAMCGLLDVAQIEGRHAAEQVFEEQSRS